jgi:hypothetical protein
MDWRYAGSDVQEDISTWQPCHDPLRFESPTRRRWTTDFWVISLLTMADGLPVLCAQWTRASKCAIDFEGGMHGP